ncbi:hypothetical protein OROGR_013601 [Orobanche gracilis]
MEVAASHHRLATTPSYRKGTCYQMKSVTSTVTASDPPPRKRNKGNEHDIFSKLPEYLVGRILSCLPTKDAVRTSVLSKRWLSRWTFINKLDLDDSVFYSPTNTKTHAAKHYFIHFVHRLLLHTESSTLDHFSLVIHDKYDACLVSSWISAILNRNIRSLRIISSPLELPFSALTSRSLLDFKLLEELEIKMSYCAIRVPPIDVQFGCLKLLKLSGVVFTIDSSVNIAGLRLPVLKKFETVNCIWLSANSVTLEAPLLETVYIEQDTQSVSHEPRSCAINISALHLTEFTYCGHGISQPITLSHPSSAHNAYANITFNMNQSEQRVPETGSCAFLLLQQFSQVKHLKLDGSEVLTQQRVALLPVFGMLSHLELGLVTGEILLGLLLKSPVLNTLHLKIRPRAFEFCCARLSGIYPPGREVWKRSLSQA